MIDNALRSVAYPMPGKILLQRDAADTATPSGLIIIPETYSKRVKTSVATVFRIGTGVSAVKEGDRVLVGAGVGRRILFGHHGIEQSRLYVCSPWECVAKVTGEVAVEDRGEAHGGRFRDPTDIFHEAKDDLADAGDKIKGHGPA